VADKEIAALPTDDFTMKDLDLIRKFKDSGMLGLHTMKDTDIERAMSLYLDGRSYREIASVLKINKSVILFLSHKAKWYELRREYLDELQATIKDKVVEAKLRSQDFFLELKLAYEKKISKNIHQYLRTDDSAFFDKIDKKDIDVIVKITDILQRLSSETAPLSDRSLVALNGMGEGVSITRTGNNSVEITPKEPSLFSSKLKAMAEMKREMERQNQPAPKPIKEVVVEQVVAEPEDKKE